MGHQWDHGVMATWAGSSWHGLEKLVEMLTAEDLIGHAERVGAYPIALTQEPLFTKGGLNAFTNAIIGHYREHPDRVLGTVGKRYRPTACEEWRSVIEAAVAAGARPSGAFSLQQGSRVLATFEVGQTNGILTNLCLVDSFDGSLLFSCGFTSIRVVCANTLAVALNTDGEEWARFRHTASMPEKIAALKHNIGTAIAAGESVKETMHRAEQTRFRSAAELDQAFDRLFPKAPEDASKNAKTRALNAREEAWRAMTHPVNQAGDTVATLWNAATFLVDREADGSPRKAKGDADKLDSLLFGSRAERIQEIQTVIEVILRDGSIQNMTQTQALEAGVSGDQVGRAVLKDLGLDL